MLSRRATEGVSILNNAHPLVLLVSSLTQQTTATGRWVAFEWLLW